MTAEELFRHRDADHRFELVRGELRTAPFAHVHEGLISAHIVTSLGRWVKDHQLGDVLGPCGFILERNPDTVRAPDIAFIRRERVLRTDHYFPGAPDLAIEVIADSDTFADVAEKTRDWLRGGASAVIVIAPKPEIVSVHRPEGSVAVSSTLEVDDVVPRLEDAAERDLRSMTVFATRGALASSPAEQVASSPPFLARAERRGRRLFSRRDAGVPITAR